jgi:hypothetical protein
VALCGRLHGDHIVPCCSSPILPDFSSSSALGHYTIYCKKTTVMRSWWWADNCPKHVELFLRSINCYCCIELVIYIFYIFQRCTVKHKSNRNCKFLTMNVKFTKYSRGEFNGSRALKRNRKTYAKTGQMYQCAGDYTEKWCYSSALWTALKCWSEL